MKSKKDDVVLSLQLEQENEQFATLSAVQWESFILASLAQLHGAVGASIVFSVVSLVGNKAVVVLKKRGLNKFWSALSFQMVYNGKPCVIHVEKH